MNAKRVATVNPYKSDQIGENTRNSLRINDIKEFARMCDFPCSRSSKPHEAECFRRPTLGRVYTDVGR